MRNSLRNIFASLVVSAVTFCVTHVDAGTVTGTYFDMTESTVVDLTAEGTLDWI